MPGDLHNHSTCSDGSVPIHRLPQMAARLGLDTMAISDHDTLLSVRYCYEHPTQDGVRLIPATELTGYDYERHHRVHLLTFWPDPESPELIRHCDIMRQRRNECCLQSAREIEQIYPQFRTEQALEYAKDSGVLFKSGIMQALCELGLAEGVYGEVYHYLFGWNPRGVVLHSPEYLPVREVLATAKAAGAVVVFAHPTVYKSMPLLRELVAEGAIDGIEVHHPRNSPEDMAECAELCKKHDLIVTGGSDFHGANKPAISLGTGKGELNVPNTTTALTSSSDKYIIKMLCESARLSVGYKERMFEYEQVFQLPQQGYLLQGDPHRAER